VDGRRFELDEFLSSAVGWLPEVELRRPDDEVAVFPSSARSST
jgi:hypothetical protein